MGKKVKKDENIIKEGVADTSSLYEIVEENIETITPSHKVQEATFKYEKIAPAKIYNNISDLHISELMDLERACALICRHYEKSAQLDKTGNDKYKRFNTYYHSIFSELENRVIKHCEK